MKPALQVVTHAFDPETGEKPTCPGCVELQDQLTGTEREVRRLRSILAQERRDNEADARNHELWDEAAELFEHWKQVCHHPKSQFTLDRFEQARPLLNRYGPGVCRRAINGMGFDHFTTKRRNGTEQHHTGWDLLFRSADKLEEFANRAPRLDPTSGRGGCLATGPRPEESS